MTKTISITGIIITKPTLYVIQISFIICILHKLLVSETENKSKRLTIFKMFNNI